MNKVSNKEINNIVLLALPNVGDNRQIILFERFQIFLMRRKKLENGRVLAGK
jgi:hypothetical protein